MGPPAQPPQGPAPLYDPWPRRAEVWFCWRNSTAGGGGSGGDAHCLFCITDGWASYYIICYSAPHQALVTCQKFLEASCISSRQLGVLPVPHSISHSVLS